MISETVGDYLKTIYGIVQDRGAEYASTSDLAARLGISQASVTGMLKKLGAMRPRFITYRRYRGACLTPAGEKVALEVLRHHRLIESYLAQVLGYTWDQVHAEADRLEHVISEDFETRIAALLGHPRFDPHGSPIPGPDGSVDQPDDTPLTALTSGDQAIVTRVSDHDPELLRYLESIGLTLQRQIEVVEQGAFDGPLFIRVVGEETIHPLNPTVTDHVFTMELDPANPKDDNP